MAYSDAPTPTRSPDSRMIAAKHRLGRENTALSRLPNRSAAACVITDGNRRRGPWGIERREMERPDPADEAERSKPKTLSWLDEDEPPPIEEPPIPLHRDPWSAAHGGSATQAIEPADRTTPDQHPGPSPHSQPEPHGQPVPHEPDQAPPAGSDPIAENPWFDEESRFVELDEPDHELFHPIGPPEPVPLMLDLEPSERPPEPPAPPSPPPAGSAAPPPVVPGHRTEGRPVLIMVTAALITVLLLFAVAVTIRALSR